MFANVSRQRRIQGAVEMCQGLGSDMLSLSQGGTVGHGGGMRTEGLNLWQ